ncbi:MAG: type II toxin-antitoxin system HicA family toxin [Aestuariivirga sp.]
MVDGYYKAVCAELKKLGFIYERNAKGSHEKWLNRDSGQTLVVPRNLFSRYTANNILKDAGSTRRF